MTLKLPSGKVVYPNTPIYPGSHFTWREATKNLSRVPEDLIIDDRLIVTALEVERNIVKAAKELDKYRAALGNHPVIITSWYRPKAVNRSVSRSKYSLHQYGHAVDWKSQYYGVVQTSGLLNLYRNHPGGYELYKNDNFIHTDWRGYKARW